MTDATTVYVARRPVFAGHGHMGGLVAEGSTLVLKDKVFIKPEHALRRDQGPSVIPANMPEAEALAAHAAAKAAQAQVGTPAHAIALSDAKNLNADLLQAGGVGGGPNPKDPPTPAGADGKIADPLLTAKDGDGKAQGEPADPILSMNKDDIYDRLEKAGIVVTPEIAALKRDDVGKPGAKDYVKGLRTTAIELIAATAPDPQG